MITLNINRPWHLFLPKVYRYMDQEHIDTFFETGELRLSSFQTFKNYRDEQRGDDQEGRVLVKSTGKDGFSFTLMSEVGRSDLILCTSLLHSDEMKLAFETNGVFRINNTFEFAAAIGASIPKFKEGFEGCCIYTDYPVAERNVPGQSVEDFTHPETGNFIIGGPNQGRIINQMRSTEDYLRKRLKYAYQMEYRFVWGLAGKADSFLMVKYPAALEFCERMS